MGKEPHGCVSLLNDGSGSRLMTKGVRSMLACFLLASLLLSGCTSVIGPPEPKARLSVDVDSIHAGEAVNFDARESSTPDTTVIVEFLWDFGDGTTHTSTQGLATHVYEEQGTYEANVQVSNDQGGADLARWTIHVNGYPQVSLAMPTTAKVSDLVTLDASSSADPEGGVLAFAWDLNWSADSDIDGDTENDVDSTETSVSLLLNSSGRRSGSVTVTDDQGASIIRVWSIDVYTRTWKVVWEERRISINWSGYLAQGETWAESHVPGTDGRLLAVNATLTLEMDLLPGTQPQDNFTLGIAVPDSGWTDEAQTDQEDFSKPTTAYIEREGMNPRPVGEQVYDADHADDLREQLLFEVGARFGQGEWVWSVRADDADPDFLVDGFDPDEGNDWDLTVEFIVLMPRVSELSV